MPRIVITVTDEMDRALKRQARRRGWTVAALVRHGLALFLRRQGETIRLEVLQGGPRPSKSEIEDSGETEPVGLYLS
jgi:hypothetical protein